jgi:cytochrome c-type biogenesis protein CcmH
MAKLPVEAAAATMLMLVLLLTPARLLAQHVESPQKATLIIRSPEERAVARKLACWCGGCSKLPVDTCVCSHCGPVKEEIAEKVKSGMTEAQVLQYFMTKEGGQHVLSEPISGVGRFAWVIPYGIGATGLLLVGFAAIRWSRRRDDTAADDRPDLSSGAADPLSAQLDDELRDLD